MTAQKSWYALMSPDDGPVEVRIYDDIGMFGITASDFVRDIATITADAVTVRINSYGGDVFEGIAILNAIRAMDATTTVVVDGIAASIASVIAMGGDTVVMNQNSQMMIHNAWNFASGNADELQRVANGLRSMSSNIATIYADKAGGTPDEWQALMNDETWYTAQEAVAAGLADEAIIETVKMPQLAGVARASAALSHFKYPGREAAPAPIFPARNKTPQPQVEAEANQGKEPRVATLNESLVELLGLDADADDDTITAKVTELYARPEKQDDPAPAAAPTLEQATAVAKAADMAVLPSAQLAEMQTALAGLQAKDTAREKADDERFLDDAMKAGKFGPASKAAFAKLMEMDRPGTRNTIAELPSNTIPVAEMGHGQGSELDHLDAELSAGYTALTGRTIGKDA